MLQLKPARLLLLVILVTMAALWFQSPALAQCAMCRASLAGSNNANFIRNFNIGVLVLLIPPVTMFCGIFVVLRRHKLADEQSETVDDRDDQQ
jgi:hypothetical protein